MYLVVTLIAATTFSAKADISWEGISPIDARNWQVYTSPRFGFSVRYPDNWRVGNPLPDGVGVTLYPLIQNSLVAFSGHMNIVGGRNQDGRQTLQEFADAHRRIITDLYEKKAVPVTWRQDETITLAGFPARHLSFTYVESRQGQIVEHHIISLGRNEGRGIRVKVPLADEARLLSVIKTILETYQPGRDQNAVSPVMPKQDTPR
ncbi:MAG: hypothetical protein QM706_03185 [Nitrospira sp.]